MALDLAFAKQLESGKADTSALKIIGGKETHKTET